MNWERIENGCDWCGGGFYFTLEDFVAPERYNNKVVPDIAVFGCHSCDFTFLPHSEEQKIDRALGITNSRVTVL